MRAAELSGNQINQNIGHRNNSLFNFVFVELILDKINFIIINLVRFSFKIK